MDERGTRRDETDQRGQPERFSGFADLYDAHRPAPPDALGPLLARYAGVARPAVVDLGSGTGLSSRWASGWAGAVVGIEPNDDMRAVAEARPAAGVSYRSAVADATGLEDGWADVVLAVQAMHWMEPNVTLAEVARILRPRGVFAVIDADWPPVTGCVGAERAWATLHRRIRVLEARVSRGEAGDDLRRPTDDDDPALVDDNLADPHRNRAMPAGLRSWSKSDHLRRLASSGSFGFTREVLFDQPADGGADRFVALMRSQGSYQGLRRRSVTDQELGMSEFEHDVHDAFARAVSRPTMSFSWRVRLGVRTG